MSTKYSIKFTPHSRNDLDNIFDYISNTLYAPESAKNLMQKIEKSILNLSDYPLMSPLIDDKLLARKGLRKLVIDDYIVIYKALKNSCEVIIYRVLNGKIDYINLMKN